MSGRGIVRKEEGIHQTRNTTCDEQINVENRQSKVPYISLPLPLYLSHFPTHHTRNSTSNLIESLTKHLVYYENMDFHDQENPF